MATALPREPEGSATELARFGGRTLDRVLQLRQLHGGVRALGRASTAFPRKVIRYLQLGLETGWSSRRSRGSATTAGSARRPVPREAEPGELMMATRRWLTSRYDWTGLSRRLYLGSPLAGRHAADRGPRRAPPVRRARGLRLPPPRPPSRGPDHGDARALRPPRRGPRAATSCSPRSWASSSSRTPRAWRFAYGAGPACRGRGSRPRSFRWSCTARPRSAGGTARAASGSNGGGTSCS